MPRFRPALRFLSTRAPSRVLSVLAACTATACAQPPETFPERFHAALASGDPAQVTALVERNSRPLVLSMLQVPRGQGPQPYVLPDAPSAVPRVLRIDAGEAALTLTVSDSPDPRRSREWVLVREGGDWKLDLTATAARRAWEMQ